MKSPKAKAHRVLVIDDDPSMGTIVKTILEGEGQKVASAITLGDGLRTAREERFDVILLDHRLPDGDGLEHIESLIRQDRMRPIIYVTAQAGSQTAIEAIKRGAFDYLSKPLDYRQLKQRLDEALEYRLLTRIPVLVDSLNGKSPTSDVLVGRCRSMQEVYKSIGRLAALNGPVLIEGEVGTGKEMIARTIHQHRGLADELFAKLSTVDLSDHEIQRELFGPELLGATALSSEATPRRGTLLIEEIAGLSHATQSRLLRLMQEEQLAWNLIFSSSTNGRELLERSVLRSDFYYYLCPFVIHVPALRERIDDLELLVSHFMQSLLRVSPAVQSDGPPRISAAAMELLRAHRWPGNIAQLKSVLQSVLLESRGAVLATEALHRALGTDQDSSDRLEQPSLADSGDSDSWNLKAFVRKEIDRGTDSLYERAIHKLDQQLIHMVLQHTQGNQAQAARMLGMTRTSLRRKIAASRIQLSDFGDAHSGSKIAEDEAT
jgi:DNA-binding NtrC family response regulator